ncbi:MAG: hypothetical protein ACOVOO_03990 [Flavobacteriales bacterium]
MNKLSFFTLLIFFFGGSSLYAQELLLNKNVNAQTARNDDERNYGYNGKHFVEGFYNWGIAYPIEQNDSLAFRKSFLLDLGIRYRRKLGTHTAIGIESRVQRTSYRLKQSAEQNILGFGQSHKSQKLILNTIQVEPFFRIGFGSKGMVFSRSIDIGFDLAFVWYSRLMTKDFVDPQLNNGAKRIKYSAINPDYINYYQTSITVRYGVNETAFWVKYRLSDLFVPSSSVYNGKKLPELSPVVMGFEINTLRFKRKKEAASQTP